MNEFTRPIAQPAIPTPARDPEERKAPWPLLYTRVSWPRVYLLFLAFAARVFLTEAERGLAGLFFRVEVVFLFVEPTLLFFTAFRRLGIWILFPILQ